LFIVVNKNIFYCFLEIAVMKKYFFSMVVVLTVLALTVAVFAQTAGTGTDTGAGARAGRGGIAGAGRGTTGGAIAGGRAGTQRGAGAGAGIGGGRMGGGAAAQRQAAIAAIEDSLMILKGNQSQVDHNNAIAELQAIADSAKKENAKETAKLMEDLIARQQKTFRDTVERLGITFGAGAGRGLRGGAGTGGGQTTAPETGTNIGRGGAAANIGATAVANASGGVMLESVSTTGRATRFGLQKGDVVVSINGIKVAGVDSFNELMAGIVQGAAVKIEVIRDGKTITVGREAGTGGRGGAGTGGATEGGTDSGGTRGGGNRSGTNRGGRGTTTGAGQIRA
jgi:hypothetical protein